MRRTAPTGTETCLKLIHTDGEDETEDKDEKLAAELSKTQRVIEALKWETVKGNSNVATALDVGPTAKPGRSKTRGYFTSIYFVIIRSFFSV